MLTRRSLALLLAAAAALRAASERLRGVLRPGPFLETRQGRRIPLEGDTETSAVLRDHRLAGFDVEAVGQWQANGAFRIEPIHESGLFVFRDGKPMLVSYWCEVCSIRTYAPGKCMCCQEETALDLQDPETLPAGAASGK